MDWLVGADFLRHMEWRMAGSKEQTPLTFALDPDKGTYSGLCLTSFFLSLLGRVFFQVSTGRVTFQYCFVLKKNKKLYIYIFSFSPW